jgi:transcriptional regulator with XRE-family HTH domain
MKPCTCEFGSKKGQQMLHRGGAGSIAARLRQAVLVSGMSRYELSRQADVSQSVLSRFVRGAGGLSVDNLERVAAALGLQIVLQKRGAGPQSLPTAFGGRIDKRAEYLRECSPAPLQTGVAFVTCEDAVPTGDPLLRSP